MAIVPTNEPVTSQLAVQTVERLAQEYPFIRTELLATTAVVLDCQRKVGSKHWRIAYFSSITKSKRGVLHTKKLLFLIAFL